MRTMPRQRLRKMVRTVQVWAMKLGGLGQRRTLMWRALLVCVVPLMLWLQQKLARLRQLKRCLVHAVLLSPAVEDPSKVEERMLFEHGISDLVRCQSTAARLADAAARTVPEQPIMTRLLGASDAWAALSAVTKQLSALFAKEVLQADARKGRSRGAWYVVGLASLPSVFDNDGLDIQETRQSKENAENAQKPGAPRLGPEVRRPSIQALVVEEERLLRICKGILLSACASAEALAPAVERWRARAQSLTAAPPIFAPTPSGAPSAQHELRWALLQHMSIALLSQSSSAAATSHSPVPLAHSSLVSELPVDLNIMRMQLPVDAPVEGDVVGDPMPVMVPLIPRYHEEPGPHGYRRCAVHFTLGQSVAAAALSAVSKDVSRDHFFRSTNSCTTSALLSVEPRPTRSQAYAEAYLQTPKDVALPDPTDAAGSHAVHPVVTDDMLCDDPVSPKGLAQGYGFFAPLSSDEEEEYDIAERCGSHTGASDPLRDVPLESNDTACTGTGNDVDQPS